MKRPREHAADQGIPAAGTALPKKRISRSLIVGTLLLLLLLGIGLGILGSTTYKRGMMDRYEVYLKSLLRLAQSQIDADDLAVCIETGEESEQLGKERLFLDSMKDSCDIQYVYVVKPLNTEAADNMMNVFAGVSEEEYVLYADQLPQLGQLTGSEYSPEVAQTYLDRMDRSNRVTYFSNVTEFGYMFTGLMPLHDQSGDPVAILAVDVAMDEIRETLKRYNHLTGAVIALLAVLSFAFTYLWLRRRIIHPIERLHASIDRYEHGAFDLDLRRFKKDDELRSLAVSFTDMTRRIDAYTEEVARITAEKERISTELELATRIQADMLPNIFPAFPERGEFDIYASMDPAKEVGGDFYDFFLIDEDHLCMVMADVSGKGVPAALFMMASKIILANNAQMGKSPAQVLTDTNAAVCLNNREEMFVTVWLGILEISTGKLTAANAGHEYPVLKTPEGSFELIKDKHGFVIGGMEDMEYQDYELTLEKGAKLFLYTDGVPEATNARREFFGPERMLAALNEQPDAPPENLLKNVRASLDGFVKEAEQFDDLTMLCLEYKG